MFYDYRLLKASYGCGMDAVTALVSDLSKQDRWHPSPALHPTPHVHPTALSPRALARAFSSSFSCASAGESRFVKRVAKRPPEGLFGKSPSGARISSLASGQRVTGTRYQWFTQHPCEFQLAFVELRRRSQKTQALA